MKQTRERMKATLMMEAEVMIDALLDQQERWEQPTLMEIEEVILDLRKRIGQIHISTSTIWRHAQECVGAASERSDYSLCGRLS